MEVCFKIKFKSIFCGVQLNCALVKGKLYLWEKTTDVIKIASLCF